MARKMTTTDIQLVSLDILKDVHSFCKKNNINYSLSYGTLLGAIRHKGFIPWDDDLDIMMPRPDYERFIQSYQSINGYKLLPEGKDSMIAMARVYDTQRTNVIMHKLPWCKKKIGVWIDIFPIDGAENDFSLFKNRVDKIYNLWERNIHYRLTQISFDIQMGFKKNLKLLAKKILWRKHNTNQDHIKLMKTIQYGSTEYATSLAVPDCKEKEYYPLMLFNKYIEYEFENNKFMIIKEYEEYLNKIYSNYMELPPIEERIPKHTFNEYYWK